MIIIKVKKKSGKNELMTFPGMLATSINLFFSLFHWGWYFWEFLTTNSTMEQYLGSCFVCIICTCTSTYTFLPMVSHCSTDSWRNVAICQQRQERRTLLAHKYGCENCRNLNILNICFANVLQERKCIHCVC